MGMVNVRVTHGHGGGQAYAYLCTVKGFSHPALI